MPRGTFDIKATVRRAPFIKGARRLPFEQLKKAILAAQYELSLVICGDALSRSINKKYRGKTYAANVLSFPLSPLEGEMFLNLRAAEREAAKYGVSLKRRLALLYVHALFHLKEMEHGDRMEREEQKTLKAFNLD